MVGDKRKALNEPYFGEKIGHILKELEVAIVERNDRLPGDIPHYSNDAFRASLCIFCDAALDKMWEYHEKLDLPMRAREEAVTKFANELRALIYRYCDIATEKL